MDLYFAAKWVHVLSAAVLFGTGMGIAFFMFMAHRTGNVPLIAGVGRLVVIADFLFTATAVVVQPVSGLLLIHATGLGLFEGWLTVTYLLYVLTGLCWLPVVWIQARMARLARAAHEGGTPLPPEYHRLFNWWFWLGWPAFSAVLAIYWLMIAKPDLVL